MYFLSPLCIFLLYDARDPIATLPERVNAPSRTNLGDRILETVEAEIVSGQLPSGFRIDERMLMERFQVSRTPAREALLQLISSGLVTSVPRQGGVVSSVSLPEYIAMLEILMELEGLAARLAARRMPGAQRRELEKAAAACEAAAKTGEAVRYGEANRAFHEIIYDGSGNAVLARQLRVMRSRMRHPQDALFDRPGRIRNSLAEHRVVVEAILAGDEEAADRGMTGHILSGGNVWTDTIASMTRLQASTFPPREPPAPAPAKRKRATKA